MKMHLHSLNQDTCHQKSLYNREHYRFSFVSDINVTEAFGGEYSMYAMYRSACRLLLPIDFNYNNLLEAYNPVSQDGKAVTLLATCHTYK